MGASQALNVAFCVDRGYVLPLAVALKSLDAVSTADEVVAHVVDPGLSSETRARLVDPLQHTEVRWHEADDAALAGAHYSTFLSRASLYRLLLGELLSADLERVVYVDADTMVCGSLRDLHDYDLDGHVAGAVRDSNTPWAASLIGSPWRTLGLDPGASYFNSGVMLIDLDLWRSAEVGPRVLDVLRKHSPQWGDQDGLNTVLADRWSELPRRWNVQTSDLTGDTANWALWREEIEAAVAEPGILHLTGLAKPWNAGQDHPVAAQWFSWVDQTAWAGWRPQERTIGPVERTARAALRSARAVHARLTRRSALPDDVR